ncbi:pantoate kinase [Methanogenium organophilum]|uniref:Pantoate kinase n=1 Tax=Methanogenium organophilum TaxID=2199 RepID=A0A9X9T8H3_METOG|nr:pantoate kinase [Methanogenium organophilum]WAI01152.1 pantoate kinase [Methanogenium organophilum]
MAESAVGFSPGHISGYFRRFDGDSMESTGSCGGGIVIDKGVYAVVTPARETSVSVNVARSADEDTCIARTSPPIEYALERLGVTATVKTITSLPPGAGFGLSAAALLATLTAANALFETGLTDDAIARLAHISELEHQTGLGDVAACTGGGIVCRKEPGISSSIIRMNGSGVTLSALSYGGLSTADVITSPAQMARVKEAYSAECAKSPQDFFRISREFAEKSGLIPEEIRPILDACDEHGIPASMTMLGKGVFALGDQSFSVLSEFGIPCELHVAEEGFRLIEVK